MSNAYERLIIGTRGSGDVSWGCVSYHLFQVKGAGMSCIDRMRRAFCLLAVFGGLLMLAGCNTKHQVAEETMLAPQMGGADAPAWVTGAQAAGDPGRVYFVGRSLAYNVLDERGAYDAAVAHAQEQAARYITSRVLIELKEMDSSDGVRYLPFNDIHDRNHEKLNQELSKNAKIESDALVGMLREEAVYWQRWQVREEPERFLASFGFNRDRRMTRHKCWVRMSVSADKLESLLEATRAQLEAEAVQAYRDAIHPAVPVRLVTQ